MTENFLPARHEVGVTGNILMLVTLFSIVSVSGILSLCLQILNSLNISGMDEATLFKFGKLVEYGMVHPEDKKLSPKVAWSG